MKNLLKKIFSFFTSEIFRVTIFVYVVLFLLKLVIFNFHIFDHIANSLKDYDITDLIYLNQKEENRTPNPNNDIVLINIGQTRTEIAAQIKTIQKFKPKVLAIDAWFSKVDTSLEDLVLINQLVQYPNIVLAGFLEKQENDKLLYKSSATIIEKSTKSGFVNFISENENTIRYFSAKEQVNNKTKNSFSAEIIKNYNNEKYQSLIKRKHSVEYIRYTHQPSDFLRFDVGEISDSNPNLNQLKNKIVILGFLGNKLQVNSLEDINFTPLNKKLSGRSFPDTYGTYIHANIISMIMDEKYTNKLSSIWIWIISFLVCYFHLRYFVRYYTQKPMWFHVSTKIIQMISGIIITGISLVFLYYFNLKIDVSYIVLPVLLSVDCIYFYDGFIKIIHKKYPTIKSVFLTSHH